MTDPAVSEQEVQADPALVAPDTQAIAIGGPLDDVKITFRRPKGVLAVDKRIGRVWIYDYTEDILRVRVDAGEQISNARRMKAADDGNYEVISIDSTNIVEVNAREERTVRAARQDRRDRPHVYADEPMSEEATGTTHGRPDTAGEAS